MLNDICQERVVKALHRKVCVLHKRVRIMQIMVVASFLLMAFAVLVGR